MKKIIRVTTILLVFLTIITACNSQMRAIQELENKTVFSLVDDNTILLDGVINSKSLDDFNKLYAENPTIKLIKIKTCDGSINDEVNLELAKRIHNLGINTYLMDNGMVASGGTDFFLAGVKRAVGKNTKIGVHSWAGYSEVATDFPVGHANHQPYINYYKAIGFNNEEAKAFYYFTINSASADNIHWMTKQELKKYNILKIN